MWVKVDDWGALKMLCNCKCVRKLALPQQNCSFLASSPKDPLFPQQGHVHSELKIHKIFF